MRKRFAKICFVVICLSGLNAPPVRASDDQFARLSLKEISALSVTVEGLPPGAQRLGLTKEAIQTDVELKLRLAGMRVATGPEPAAAFLYVAVNLTDDAQAANIEVGLEQAVTLRLNSLDVPAETWSTGLVLARPTSQGIRDSVKDSVDKFLNAWLTANPKK